LVCCLQGEQEGRKDKMEEYKKMEYERLKNIFLERCKKNNKNPSDILIEPYSETQHLFMELYLLNDDLIQGIKKQMELHQRTIEVMINNI